MGPFFVAPPRHRRRRWLALTAAAAVAVAAAAVTVSGVINPLGEAPATGGGRGGGGGGRGAPKTKGPPPGRGRNGGGGGGSGKSRGKSGKSGKGGSSSSSSSGGGSSGNSGNSGNSGGGRGAQRGSGGAPRGRAAARNVAALQGKGVFRVRGGGGGGGGVQAGWEAARGGEFMAKFFLPSGVDFYCGGSLVGGRGDRVLSAAHCFEGADVSADVVRVGGVALFDGFQVKIKAVVLHPDYDPVTLENDLAVVTLAGMPSSKELRDAGVYPAQLNRVGGRPWVGEEVTHTGWGETSGTGGGTTVAAELAATRMRVSAHADCIAYLDGRGWDTAGLDPAHLLCASLGDSTSSCSGDSGGPLFRKVASPGGKKRPTWVLYGVLSFGHADDTGDECPVDAPEWYTRVSGYKSWVGKHLG